MIPVTIKIERSLKNADNKKSKSEHQEQTITGCGAPEELVAMVLIILVRYRHTAKNNQTKQETGD